MNKQNKIQAVIFFLTGIFLLTGVLIYLRVQKQKAEYINNQGQTQGTTYSITYLQPEGINLQNKINRRLRQFDLSLSNWNPNSIISLINKNDSTVRTDSDFENMYKMAREVSERTNGAFDITVEPLVTAWGFGSDNRKMVKVPDVSRLLPLVGYHKIRLENHKLIKDNPAIRLDAGALSQGQSCDVIAALLEENGCQNYMVEIGGEVMCKGLNPKGEKWRVGIDQPVDNPTGAEQIQAVVHVSGVAVNTSGNYRQYYYLNGKKYSHEIDPRTGFPVVRNLLSATVIAPTCMKADAYATAFMVLGIDSSLAICKNSSDLNCYLIYEDKEGKIKEVYSDGFKKYLKE